MLAAVHESMRGRSEMTLEQFVFLAAGWDMEPVTVDGKLAGAVMTKGAEIHACILPAYFGRWLSRGVLRRTLCRVLNEHGRATTATTENNPAGAYFVARLGFVPIETKNGVTTYELKRQKNGH